MSRLLESLRADAALRAIAALVTLSRLSVQAASGRPWETAVACGSVAAHARATASALAVAVRPRLGDDRIDACVRDAMRAELSVPTGASVAAFAAAILRNLGSIRSDLDTLVDVADAGTDSPSYQEAGSVRFVGRLADDALLHIRQLLRYLLSEPGEGNSPDPVVAWHGAAYRQAETGVISRTAG